MTKQVETVVKDFLGHPCGMDDFLWLKTACFVGIFDYVEDVVVFEDIEE